MKPSRRRWFDVSATRVLLLAAMIVAALIGAAVAAAFLPQRGCLRVLRPAPLLAKPAPIDVRYDPPLPPNRVVRTLEPGRYSYRDVRDAKSWRAYLLQVDTIRGYLIADDGVGACQP